MPDFSDARLNMLEGQVRTNDVSDKALQAVVSDLPRELFVPRAKQSIAYADENIEVSDGRYLMRPRSFTKLVQAANIKPHDLVLIIGCGTGYSAAVIGRLADSVVAVEEDEMLAQKATSNLEDLEIDNVAVVNAPHNLGLADQGPYNVILVDGALPERQPAIEAQLANGGRMAVILQDGPIGTAMVITRDEDAFVAVPSFDAAVPPLSGFAKEKGFVF